MINSIRFTGKRSVNWDDVKNYLKTFVDKNYRIESTDDIICIGNDLPNEYTGSVYTYRLKGAAAKAKANATQRLSEMLKIAVGRHFHENNNEKHYRNTALGWYRYDSRFALPIYGKNGHLSDITYSMPPCLCAMTKMGKCTYMTLWTLKKKQATRLSYKSCTRHKTHFSLTIILCWSDTFVKMQNLYIFADNPP